MNREVFIALFKQSLTEPREAGRYIIGLNLPAQFLWMALAFLAAVMSLLVSGMFQIVPLPEGEMGDMMRMNPAYRTPLVFALMQWGQAVISVVVLTWIGRLFGGRARVEDMLAVTIWIQLIALVLGLGVGVLAVLLPPLGAFAILAYIAWALFITVAMIDAAHGFENMLKSLGVFIASIVALALGSALIAGMIGVSATAGGL
ncbi:Yip1 family protein [Roseovarius sp. C7]|uniref:Yip1 family protein n=1 Tax=Roseovarius sp. C7 TaxID=3398643 RepID=UPI0039F5A917